MATFQFVVALAVLSGGFCAKYKEKEKVTMYVNKVGPYFNPHETYHYYQLPVCRPDKIEHKSLTLGEVLDGDRMAMSMYEINFKQNVEKKELCKVQFSDPDLQLLRDAIEDLYYFEFVVDEIPIRGFIGHLEEGGFLPHTHKIYLWAHLHFNIEYNGDQVIYANVSTKEQAPVSLDEAAAPFEVAFTYSVKWHPTRIVADTLIDGTPLANRVDPDETAPTGAVSSGSTLFANTSNHVTMSMKYEDRIKRVRDNSFFPKTLEIHWLSIINSMVLVFLLIGFVVIILLKDLRITMELYVPDKTRVLKSDFARYNVDDEESEELDQEENGWKIIHTDVFRFPVYKNLFCAILGVGSQFLTLATGIMLMAMMGMFNVHRHGSINSAGVILYAFTSCISGYVATNMYKKMGGDNWVWNINLTSALFAFPFFLVWAIVNSVAWAYGTTQALPFGTVLLLMCLWLFVGYPLTVIGGIFGKNWANGFDAPCRTKNIAREIPPCPWYRSGFAHCMVGGFLPFSAISVELYYIFATLWGREQYTLYGILFIVFGILLSVTACISVALTYFQLSAEDYRWWWRSIFSAGSTGMFVFLYALFYYFKRSNMSGLLQSLEFFGYTALTCYVFFLMLGTVSFFASLKFVRYIYVNLKMD